MINLRMIKLPKCVALILATPKTQNTLVKTY